MSLLENCWKDATEGFNTDVCDTWLARLQEVYSDEKRTYHNLDSLIEKLGHYLEIKDQLKNSKALLLALFFQK